MLAEHCTDGGRRGPGRHALSRQSITQGESKEAAAGRVIAHLGVMADGGTEALEGMLLFNAIVEKPQCRTPRYQKVLQVGCHLSNPTHVLIELFNSIECCVD